MTLFKPFLIDSTDRKHELPNGLTPLWQLWQHQSLPRVRSSGFDAENAPPNLMKIKMDNNLHELQSQNTRRPDAADQRLLS